MSSVSSDTEKILSIYLLVLRSFNEGGLLATLKRRLHIMAENYSYTREDLINLKPRYSSFVGIDSDGCVFDTMEIKQKKCFHTLIVSHWHLEPIEKYVREAAEFVNLYSKSRGRNRFPCLVDSIDLLRDRPEVVASGVNLPEFKDLREFIASGAPLGNPALEQAVQETHDPELTSVLKWSKDVNKRIASTVKNIPPFKWVRESLEKIQLHSDAICVSQTPSEALLREWQEHDLDKYVSVIAGQELGTKSEHISLATRNKYESDKILMIGDAPGDRKAAEANKALFYPINPAHEEASWERFYKEAYDKFLAKKYAGQYQEKVIAEFEALLPETPPWKKF